MYKLPLTLSFLFIVHSFAFAQSDSTNLKAITAKLERQTTTRPTEKVYLHFNKPAYAVGDTIWFKGYVTGGVHHQPSALSGVLYVELIDGRDKIIKSLKLKNNNGLSAGDFTLDSRISPGDYKIRAYTTWMRNFGAEYFFNQTINISDIKTSAVFISSAYSVNSTANNKPVNTKLAFTDKQGRPYENREVTYEVKADSDILFRSKGVTDASGNLSFTFPGKTAPGQKVKITSHFKLASGVIIDKTIPLNIQDNTIDIQFFPEGGQLVNNVRSKVAFKAIGNNGLGADVKGVILDNESNEVAGFQSTHAGMGIFALTPQAGKIYTAKITLADNTTQTVKLPIANEKGFVLSINNNDSVNLNIRIATNAATLAEKQNSAFYLAGQSAGVVYYTTAGKLDNASFNITVPKNRFPSGVAQFTLFSNTNEPLNERVTFIQNNADLLNLSLSSPKNAYTAKEKTSLSFTAKDNTGKPVQGSFSLTIFNEDKLAVGENAGSSILSNILLTSDLKGYIEEPDYYFNHPNAKADLDALMLTQGYRRFEWKEVLAGNYPAITFQPEKTLSLSGTLTDEKGKAVIPKGDLKLLSVMDKLTLDTTTDAQGKFMITGLDLQNDTTNLLLQAHKANGSRDVKIVLDDHKPSPVLASRAIGDVSENLFPPLLNPAQKATGSADTIQTAIAAKNYEFGFKRNNTLQEITVKGKRSGDAELAPWIPKVSAHSANLNGPGHADLVIGTKQLDDCTDFLTCVMNKIPSVRRKQLPNGDLIYYFERHMSQSITADPLITYMLDGVIVTIDYVRNLNVGDIATVEVLNSSSYLNVYGTTAPYGLIIITSKLGTDDPNRNYNAEISPGVMTTKFSSYYKAREFYLPKYTPANSNHDDNRDAIYWNPNVVTDAGGKFSADYFNSDIKGTYRVVVEGIDDNGNIGRQVYKYKVQ